VITLAVAACGLIAWYFLFPVPALFSLVQIASLAAAYAVASRVAHLERSGA